MKTNTSTILLTGATSGIGLSIAKELLKTDHNLIFIASNFKKHKEVVKLLENDNVHWFFCDLSLQKNVHELCKEIKSTYKTLDVLINCAGMLSSRRNITEEGIEMQIAVNHIAPFLLVRLFRENLELSKNPKVINISSRAVYRASIFWEDWLLTKNYSLTKAYNQSKLLSLMCSIAQSRRITKIQHLNIYPGLVNTAIGEKNAGSIDSFIWKVIKKLGRSPQNAAKSILLLCLESTTEYPSGSLLSPKKIVRLPKKARIQKDQERVYLRTKKMLLYE